MTTEQATGRLFTCWQTSLYDGHSHAITDEEFTFGEHKCRGEFEAVCGAVICLADSHSPPGRDCSRCMGFLRAQASLRQLNLEDRVPRHQHPGRLRRWFGGATTRKHAR